MKNIYKNSSLNLARAKKILMKNNIIGLPTETVYGLAGNAYSNNCLLYTSDAADDMQCVDLGGRRIIK